LTKRLKEHLPAGESDRNTADYPHLAYFHMDSLGNPNFLSKLLAQGLVLPQISTHFTHTPSCLARTPLRLNSSFLIMDHPRTSNMALVLKECKKHQVTQMVRVCEMQTDSYDPISIRDVGIAHVDLPFPDGKPPPDEVLRKWVDLVSSIFKDEKDSCIAVHCVAGLGRAPLMVAVALMYFGLNSTEAVALIRSRRLVM